jgi:glucose/arabinose dehydrogenase
MFIARRLRWTVRFCLLLLLAFSTSTALASPSKSLAVSFKLGLQSVADGFQTPVYVTSAGDTRLFVVEKAGRILILDQGKRAEKPFLDIVSIVRSSENERGLLSVAFHPKYADNGLFFVYYTALNGDITIARYKVSAEPNVADPASAKILLKVAHSRSNHNGGLVLFGPDGYLYTGLGDGGGGGDPDRNGQNPKTLLGKILRLDVDNGDPYAIPADNPFADGTQGQPEVWAWGLRNPWRFSFDRLNGDLYIADVGQNQYEEINVQKAGTPGGQNYGWNTMEGQHCYGTTTCNRNGKVVPVAEYDHSQGCSITGGFTYRGKDFPKMAGAYFYSDVCSGRMWALQETQPNAWEVTELPLTGQLSVSSFGQDHNGELYLTDLSSGTVYRLVDTSV